MFVMKEAICTQSPCYWREGRTIKPIGLVLHSVGCAQPNAMVFVNKWNSRTYETACCHGVIDANDGTVYHTLPWTMRGWHAGKVGNDSYIGVEMCEPDCITYVGGSTFTIQNLARAREMTKRTYDSAVQLYAMLCKDLKIDPSKIYSHKEFNQKILGESGHVDPEHLWNQLKTGYTMDGFRADVKKAMEGQPQPTPTPTTEIYRVRKTWEDSKSQIGAFRNLDSAKSIADERANDGYNVFDSKGMIAYAPKHPAPVENYTYEQFVRELQSALRVTVDGIAGSQTLGATPTISRYINPRHPAVLPVQKRLNALKFDCGEADGIAGAKFENAVKGFQKSFGGYADGELTRGNTTWKKLLLL